MTEPKLVRVYPSPDLPEGAFLAGVGVDGADVPRDRAEEWIAAGLATRTPPALPDEQPASPAKE